MLDNFRFETFVDVHSNIFDEYLSSVIAKLSKENPEYCSIEERIEELYKEYPKVMGALDTEKPSGRNFITKNGGIGVELMPLLHSRRGGKMHTFVVQLEQ